MKEEYKSLAQVGISEYREDKLKILMKRYLESLSSLSNDDLQDMIDKKCLGYIESKENRIIT